MACHSVVDCGAREEISILSGNILEDPIVVQLKAGAFSFEALEERGDGAETDTLHHNRVLPKYGCKHVRKNEAGMDGKAGGCGI
jgi:hypothetical protein